MNPPIDPQKAIRLLDAGFSPKAIGIQMAQTAGRRAPYLPESVLAAIRRDDRK